MRRHSLLNDARVVRWLTAEVIARRFELENTRKDTMALELKGLKGKALRARAHLDALNAAYDKFNDAAPAHVADVEGLTEQIGGMQEDLEFATNVLGNSVNGFAGSQDARAEPPAVKLPNPPQNESAASPSPPAVGPAATFPVQ